MRPRAIGPSRSPSLSLLPPSRSLHAARGDIYLPPSLAPSCRAAASPRVCPLLHDALLPLEPTPSSWWTSNGLASTRMSPACLAVDMCSRTLNAQDAHDTGCAGGHNLVSLGPAKRAWQDAVCVCAGLSLTRLLAPSYTDAHTRQIGRRPSHSCHARPRCAHTELTRIQFRDSGHVQRRQ